MLGYPADAIKRIVDYAVGRGTLAGAPGVNHESLAARGFTPEKIAAVEKAVASAFDIKFVFNKWTLGEDFLHRRARAEAWSGSTSRISTFWPRSASASARSRRPTNMPAGR